MPYLAILRPLLNACGARARSHLPASTTAAHTVAPNTPVPFAIWAIIGLALAIRITLAIVTRYTSEDYMITLRYAENMASGHGMVYNEGERVLGTTTPLYTLILALTARIHLSPTVCGKAINILADETLCLLLYLWLRLLGHEKAGRFAAFLAAVHPLHFQWAISGMETSLVTTVGIWAWYAAERRNYVETYCSLGLLFLLRWDSLLMTAILTFTILLRERRLPIRALCLFVLIITPWLVAATRYYGSPIPITGQAKITVYGWYADHWPEDRLRFDTTAHGMGLAALIRWEPTWLLRRLPRQQKLLNFFVGSPVQALLTIAAVIGWLQCTRRRDYGLAGPVAWLIVYVLTFLLSRILLFNWYLVPPFPVFEMLASLGCVSLSDQIAVRVPPRITRFAVIVGFFPAAVGPAVSMYSVLRQSQMIEENARIPIGLWLERNSGQTDRVLLEPIGYIGYYSRRRIIDVIGLVSPEVLTSYSPSAIAPWLTQIRQYQPEWCVLRPTELMDIEQAATAEGYSWSANYRLVKAVAYSPRPQEEPLVFYIFRRQ